MTHLSWKVKIFSVFQVNIHKTSNLIVDGHPSSTGIPPAVNLKLLEDAISRWDIFRDMWECIWDWYIGYQKTRRISASPSWIIHHLIYQISEQRPVMMPSVSPILPPHGYCPLCLQSELIQDPILPIWLHLRPSMSGFSSCEKKLLNSRFGSPPASKSKKNLRKTEFLKSLLNFFGGVY